MLQFNVEFCAAYGRKVLGACRTTSDGGSNQEERHRNRNRQGLSHTQRSAGGCRWRTPQNCRLRRLWPDFRRLSWPATSSLWHYGRARTSHTRLDGADNHKVAPIDESDGLLHSEAMSNHLCNWLLLPSQGQSIQSNWHKWTFKALEPCHLKGLSYKICCRSIVLSAAIGFVFNLMVRYLYSNAFIKHMMECYWIYK